MVSVTTHRVEYVCMYGNIKNDDDDNVNDAQGLVTSEADRRGGVVDGKHPWTLLDEDPLVRVAAGPGLCWVYRQIQ